MLINIGVAALMMIVTTAIHSGAMMLALRAVGWNPGSEIFGLRQMRIYRVGGIVLLMFLASLAEVTVWTATYLALGASRGLERTLYFSMVTFTTLGYGDIVLDERWHLLGSFEAANGLIMFGWTTAIVVAAVRRIHFGEEPERHYHAESSNKQRHLEKDAAE